jgi:hypothetical protein
MVGDFSVNAFTFSPARLHPSFLLRVTCAKPSVSGLRWKEKADQGRFEGARPLFTKPSVVTCAFQIE